MNRVWDRLTDWQKSPVVRYFRNRHESGVGKLVVALGSKDTNIASEAEQALVKIGSPAVPLLIDNLKKETEESEKTKEDQIDLFADFNGLPSEAAKTDFYQHEAHWSNRMILGDSLQVMDSLAERE